MKKFIGVDIGGTKCAVVKGDERGNIYEKVRFDTQDCRTTVEKIIETVMQMGECDAVGISCGGPLDSKKGIIMSPPNLPDWYNVPIVSMIKEKTGVPAGIRNDADACAVAEWKFGAGVGEKNMIFLTFGTGLGAGLILGGRLYSGECDSAGEAGHIRLASHGPVGYGKSGSFEGFCSGGGIAQLASTMALERIQSGKTCSYCDSIDALGSITAKTVADKAYQGHDDAIAVYTLCGEMLGKGLSVLVDILNPGMIVLGSIFARCEDLLRPAMERVIVEECLPQCAKACKIVPAALGESIGDKAALSVAAEVFENER